VFVRVDKPCGVTIAIDDPRRDDVSLLLGRHVEFALAQTPPEDSHALDAEALVEPGVTFFSYRRDGELLGVGALKALDDSHAEVKSMHTVEASRGQGVGRAMVEHLIAVARERGFRRVSLETGTGPAFAAARTLYTGAGFSPCEPFGDYRRTDNNFYMTMCL
jgi:putative acetyltransferase